MKPGTSLWTLSKMENQVTKELPLEAQRVIKEVKAQMFNLESQLKNFIDGVLVGMGMDVNSNPEVNLDTMTVTIKGGDEPALKE